MSICLVFSIFLLSGFVIKLVLCGSVHIVSSRETLMLESGLSVN